MWLLGERLLDGRGLTKSIEEGERLLRQAVDLGDTYTMRALGERLLDRQANLEESAVSPTLG